MSPGTPYDGSTLLRPPATAVALTAIRGLPDGSMRQYSATEFRRGWSGVDHFIRTLKAVGYIEPGDTRPSYAVLDVLDAEGDIVADYNIPTSTAFRFIKRKLGLVVETP